jgi:hypothetical protein
VTRLLLALLLIAAAADARSLSIETFHAEIEVSEDGFVSVTETLSVAFKGSLPRRRPPGIGARVRSRARA